MREQEIVGGEIVNWETLTRQLLFQVSSFPRQNLAEGRCGGVPCDVWTKIGPPSPTLADKNAEY